MKRCRTPLRCFLGLGVVLFSKLFAADSMHWAYRPLQEVSIPWDRIGERADWVRSPLDVFVLEEQLERGLYPSEEADRRTWLRRVSFDLIGLPPTASERQAFLLDARADAWERVVDRLLGSPHYGERWARHWMDLVHYAETHGHDQDRPREHAWPYRDYLIRAFNLDKPYVAFAQEQVAGDVLFPMDPWATVATGFLATGPWDESSLRDIRPDSIDRVVGQYVDRDDIVTTTCSTFLSTTVHCARCHDHKFDPITQKEYYSLQAVFAGVDKANQPFDWDPQVGLERQRLSAEIDDIRAWVATGDERLMSPNTLAEARQWEFDYHRKRPRWASVEVLELAAEQGTELQALDDGSFLASRDSVPEKDIYELIVYTSLKRVSGIRIETLADESLPEGGPGLHENGNFHLTELKVDQWVEARGEWRELGVNGAVADFGQTGWGVEDAIDGKAESGWGVHPETGTDHWGVFTLAQAASSMKGGKGIRIRVRLEQAHGRQHLIGRFRISVTDSAIPETLPEFPAPVEQALKKSWDQRSQSEHSQIVGWVIEQRLRASLDTLPKVSLVYSGTNHFAPDGSFIPSEKPRPVHLLERGDVLRPGPLVPPGTLSLLKEGPVGPVFEWDSGQEEGERRRALAQWLTSEENPLFWRSIVNRVWLYHFGQGLVETPNDFGMMGTKPTHPELLEWLAVRFRDSGGAFKSLHRDIVLSATYRQSSNYQSDRAKIDGNNRYLWRMIRRRMDAESIRDSMLLLSGELDTRMGGVSDRQFIESKGVHVTPTLDYLNFDPRDPANVRRSVYRFIFRTVPDPFMEAMDCPDASLLSPQRQESMTALQALAVLNDKQVVYQSERLAEQVEGRYGTLEERAAMLFEGVLGRAATVDEVGAVVSYARDHGLANACRFLFNSNEFIFID